MYWRHPFVSAPNSDMCNKAFVRLASQVVAIEIGCTKADRQSQGTLYKQ